MKTNELCVICENEIDIQPNGWGGGHNAQPIAEGQCCTDCNNNIVTPARLGGLLHLIETGGREVN